MDDCQPRTIWMLGDPWRDLRDDLLLAGTTTVVTEQSVYFVDVAAGFSARFPGPHAADLRDDWTIQPLVALDVATPCGIVLDLGEGRTRHTTRLALVLDGWQDLATSHAVAVMVELIEAGVVGYALHEGSECGALWCITHP